MSLHKIAYQVAPSTIMKTTYIQIDIKHKLKFEIPEEDYAFCLMNPVPKLHLSSGRYG
jgi:hypothetical protein